jgi:hypothetical protein
MASQPAEVLVVLDEDTAEEALERVRGAVRVTQVAPPRLVVCETTSSEREASLRSIPGVVAVTGADVPEELLGRLSPEEELFVAAWSRRLAESGRKERRGEGLPWDAPGYSPPDAPPDER